MSAALKQIELPPGDPRKPSWTYVDLAAHFELGIQRVKVLMRDWSAEGFPAPLPYSARPKRWRPAPVIAWAGRHERKVGARPVELMPIRGGRDG